MEDYLAKQDRSSKIFQYINKNTPPTSKILLVNEIRTFYLNRENIRDLYYRVYDKYHLNGVDKIIKDIKAKGITHVLYAESANRQVKEKHTGNRLSELVNNEYFVRKYLDEIEVVKYDIDSTQETRYVLYGVK